ncbi:site-specific DNA-methyltransferase [Okeania sp.]|uniref:DNA-methyltransferase n=1 Tax=Okeania sp. TaxID=3100323 RepID=UPI002B4AF5E2|nr:site-specific DNA-methyltransferase [Okeania sp.]MEB3339833.1 site-specific DNA-methyltransferase [Okeania sp.]
MNFFSSQQLISEEFNFEANLILYPGEAADFINTIPDNSVALIITSPPYNIGKNYEQKIALEDYLETQEKLLNQMYRILREDGSICWQVGNFIQKGEVFPLDIFYYQIFKKLQMFLRNRIIWHYGHGLHAQKRFSGRYETILWFSKSDNYIFNLDPVRVPAKYPGKRHYKGAKKGQLSGNKKGKNPSDVWEILAKDWEAGIWDIPNVKSNHPEKTNHPCQYPVELVERCVLALTNENDFVFDPYAGTGTSLIAAIKNNRKAMGSEKELDYIEIARNRINSYYNGTLRTRPLGKPVYVPTGKEKVSQIPDEWKDHKQMNLFEEQEEK